MPRKIIIIIFVTIALIAVIVALAFYLSNKSNIKKQEKTDSYLRAEFEQTAGAITKEMFK